MADTMAEAAPEGLRLRGGSADVDDDSAVAHWSGEIGRLQTAETEAARAASFFGGTLAAAGLVDDGEGADLAPDALCAPTTFDRLATCFVYRAAGAVDDDGASCLGACGALDDGEDRRGAALGRERWAPRPRLAEGAARILVVGDGAGARGGGAAARVVAAWTAADAAAHDSAARGLRFRHMALRASAGFDVHVVLHEVDAGDLDAVEGAGGGRGRVTFAEATAARARVDIKSSTRLQCERNRTVWTRLFRCASRT